MAKVRTVGFRTYYSDREKVPPTEFDPNNSLTDQDYKMMTDVNYLLEHMAGHSRTPIYGEQDMRTFEDWSNEMALVKRRFMNLSKEERDRFGNPQKFLAYCSNPDNFPELHPDFKKKKIEEKLLLDQQNMELIEDRKAKKLAKAIKEG